METAGKSKSPAKTAIKVKPIEATPESFKEYGQVISASPDGDHFGPHDAQLDLSRGIPRFSIMHLVEQPLEFKNVSHHANVTQCLGSVGGHIWYLGVAKSSILDSSKDDGDAAGRRVVKSRCGHTYVPPVVDDVKVFKIEGPRFIKLNRGTWHAGPLFKEDAMDFYNLELSNTNDVDFTTHKLSKENAVFVVDE